MKNHPKPNTQPFLRFLLLVYAAGMLYLLFVRDSGWISGIPYSAQLRQNLNLKLFYTIRNYLHVIFYSDNTYLVYHCLTNLLGNVLLFVPVGLLIPTVFQKPQHFLVFFLLCLILIVLIELVQLLTLLGSFDVDDILLNLFGMVLGFWVRLLFVSRKK